MNSTPDEQATASVEFLPEELLQLQRDDIPYFFFTLDDPRIRFYTANNLRKADYIREQKWGSSRIQAALHPRKLFLNSSRRKTLYDHGSLILSSYLLPSSFSGELHYRNLRLIAKKRIISIQYNDDVILQGPRKISGMLTPFAEEFLHLK